MPLNQTLLVQVTDNGRLTDNATVVLSFKVKGGVKWMVLLRVNSYY
jgi:hypothetical protein